jgi:hypothetical protein
VVSAATAALIAGGIAIVGALLGAVVGLVVQDQLRRRGEVRFDVRAWVDGRPIQGGGEYRDFEARFFNDRDVNVSVWNLEVEFCEGEATIARMLPERPRRSPGDQRIPVEPIELPARTSVYQNMRLETRDQFLETVKRADHARFVAVIVPGNERISAPLCRWSPFERARPWPIHRTS